MIIEGNRKREDRMMMYIRHQTALLGSAFVGDKFNIRQLWPIQSDDKVKEPEMVDLQAIKDKFNGFKNGRSGS